MLPEEIILQLIRQYPNKLADKLEEMDANVFSDIIVELRQYAKEKGAV